MEQKEQCSRDLESYLDLIQFLNEGTDDYFFVWNIPENRINFAGEIQQKCLLPQKENDGYTLQDFEDIIYARDREAMREQLSLIAEGQREICNIECRIVDKDGHTEWISCRGKSRLDEDGIPRWMMGRISWNALIRKSDALTGLFNGDKFMEDMQQCLEHNCAGHLLLLGIDNFKHINIKYGRTFGNHVLRKVTQILETHVEPSMNIYRLDGDRFAVALQGQGEDVVRELYEKVKEDLKDCCTISAGAFFCPGNSSEECGMIYQYAEAALDRAKEEGKNRLVFFSPDHYKKRLDTIRLLDEMRKDMKAGCENFYLQYQPLIDCRDFHVRGAEALLRYDSPINGKTGPTEFIPLLEQTKLICPVGEWVLETALKQCREWQKKIPDFHININISYAQLREDGISSRVLDLLNESGLPGEALTLEVTESMQLQDYQHFNKLFRRWKEYGINIAIDDFGTGYSSLSYLKSLEIDEIKIDRSFVTNIQNSSYNYRLLNNVIELAHSARIKVCCEGVETEEELLALESLKPDVLQGFFFARPCDREAFRENYVYKTHDISQK